MSDFRPRIVTTHVEITRTRLSQIQERLDAYANRLDELSQYMARKRWLSRYVDLYEEALQLRVREWIKAMEEKGLSVTDFDYPTIPQESLRRHRLQIIGCYVSLGQLDKAINEVNRMEPVLEDQW